LTVLKLPVTLINIIKSNISFAWHKINQSQIDSYQSNLSFLLRKISKADVDTMYDDIVSSIITAANISLPKCSYNKHAKPYWTPKIKEAHTKQRKARREWINEGRPRGLSNKYYENYKSKKYEFIHLQKKEIQNIENVFIKQLEDAAECDNRLFWSLIKMKKGRKLLTCTQLETENGLTRDPDKIADTFRDFYENLYSPLQEPHFDENFKINIENAVQQIKLTNNRLPDCPEILPCLSADVINKHVKTLKNNKAPSFDMICNEHIKLGGFNCLTV
jgi:hypothetical protein